MMSGDKSARMHHGHRERLRKRFNSIGFEGWAPHEVLEYMLFYVYSRQDTNEIAHNLISQSGGTLSKLFDNTDGNCLLHVENVGTKVVEYLRALKAFVYYYNNNAIFEKSTRLTRESFLSVVGKVGFNDDEEMLMICTDVRMVIKYIARIAKYTETDFAMSNLGEMQRVAVDCNADNVVLVHNHPSGSLKPSKADMEMTKKIGKSLEALGITLIDHFVVCDNNAVSIKQAILEMERRKKGVG